MPDDRRRARVLRRRRSDIAEWPRTRHLHVMVRSSRQRQHRLEQSGSARPGCSPGTLADAERSRCCHSRQRSQAAPKSKFIARTHRKKKSLVPLLASPCRNHTEVHKSPEPLLFLKAQCLRHRCQRTRLINRQHTERAVIKQVPVVHCCTSGLNILAGRAHAKPSAIQRR